MALPSHGSMVVIMAGWVQWVLAKLRVSRFHINITKTGRAVGFGGSWPLELFPFTRRIPDLKGTRALRASRAS